MGGGAIRQLVREGEIKAPPSAWVYVVGLVRFFWFFATALKMGLLALEPKSRVISMINAPSQAVFGLFWGWGNGAGLAGNFAKNEQCKIKALPHKIGYIVVCTSFFYEAHAQKMRRLRGCGDEAKSPP